METEGSIQRRRRVPREEVTWKGSYQVDGDAAPSECDVVDISVIGVGIQVRQRRGEDLIGRTITIEVHPSVTAAVSLRLTGEIRYVIPIPEGGVRIGGQFVGLSDTERSILDTFERMHLAW